MPKIWKHPVLVDCEGVPRCGSQLYCFTSSPYRVCSASWSRSDRTTHLWHYWRTPCRSARRGTWGVGLSCAWTPRRGDRFRPNGSEKEMKNLVEADSRTLKHSNRYRTSIALLPQPMIWPVPMYATEVGISPHCRTMFFDTRPMVLT